MERSVSYSTTRRCLLKGAGSALIGFGATSVLKTVGVAAGAETLSMQLQLDWLMSNQFLGDVAAKRLGYFEEEGLDVTISPGGPQFNGIPAVASEQALIGNVSSSPHIMLARAGGVPITCVAAGFQRHPFAYFSLPRNPIRTPAEMRGKRIGTPQVSVILLRALLKANGIQENELDIVPMGSEPGPLLTGQVDAMTFWETDPIVKPLGPDAIILRLWDAGIRLYASPYYVSDSTLRRQPDRVAAFVRAVSRGWAYAKQNPEKAVDLYVAEYPSADRASELEQVGLLLSYVFNDETKTAGWGAMQREIWADQLDMYEQLGQFTNRKAPTVDEMMTLSILDATQADRPKL
ncbi:ABC transporter substrate-binding protein [Mesorhizobium sp.]|uniref:ABC transporter substrate-binding protein n=1 Tax=Mesorhizobium sp. TaxID=1871066 RepID=UPI000FEA9F7E|nr:ABC transporter substrate-binding protein [Mesorhizobium sp.]RWI87927.1 MAG: nitrate ABC transporter substrate-binding protein [Mesorhizobium sp.]